jgi:hypothetical protein
MAEQKHKGTLMYFAKLVFATVGCSWFRMQICVTHGSACNPASDKLCPFPGRPVVVAEVNLIHHNSYGAVTALCYPEEGRSKPIWA